MAFAKVLKRGSALFGARGTKLAGDFDAVYGTVEANRLNKVFVVISSGFGAAVHSYARNMNAFIQGHVDGRLHAVHGRLVIQEASNISRSEEIAAEARKREAEVADLKKKLEEVTELKKLLEEKLEETNEAKKQSSWFWFGKGN